MHSLRWRQSGGFYCWRYSKTGDRLLDRSAHGSHLSVDRDGEASLLALLDELLATPYSSIAHINCSTPKYSPFSPARMRQAAHLMIKSSRLKLPAAHWELSLSDKVVTVVAGEDRLRELRDAVLKPLTNSQEGHSGLIGREQHELMYWWP